MLKDALTGFSVIKSFKAENILRRCTGLFALKNGEVSERGTFEELMGQKGYFYSLFTVSQK